MAGSRASRSAARSSPTSTPKSAKSTPTLNRSSSLRQSITPASRKRAPPSQKPSTSRKKRAKNEKDGHSPTGMTETESPSSSDAGSEDNFDPPSSDEDELVEDVEEAIESDLNSDFLDEEDSDGVTKVKKRHSMGGGAGGSAKKRIEGKVQVDGYEDEDDQDEEVELEEGQEIAGRIYPAPKTGHGESSEFPPI